MFASTIKPIYENYCQPPRGVRFPEPQHCVPICWSWSADTVKQWLVNTGFGRYRCYFEEHGINGQKLLSIDLQQLRNMGIKDRDDAIGIWSNAMTLRHQYRNIQPEESPDLPFNYTRAICFGEQTSLPRPYEQGQIRYTAGLPSSTTLRRILNIAGDRYSWYSCNKPHQTM